jgi:hypothetical protein
MRRLLGTLIALVGLVTAAGVFFPHSAPVNADDLPFPAPPPVNSLCASATIAVATVDATTEYVHGCLP